jgi:hypothetical protein
LDNTAFGQYRIRPIQHSPSTTFAQYSIRPIQHLSNTSFVQYSIRPIQHSPNTAFAQYSICPIQHLPSTAFAQYSICPVQHLPSLHTLHCMCIACPMSSNIKFSFKCNKDGLRNGIISRRKLATASFLHGSSS